MSFINFKTQISLCALLVLSGCAVQHTPVELAPITTVTQRTLFTLDTQVELQFDTGYTRVLKAGSQWQSFGNITQGRVYKPFGDIFTVEGANVHEAYLVIAEGRLVGFYLPVERGFSSLKHPVSIPLSVSNSLSSTK